MKNVLVILSFFFVYNVHSQIHTFRVKSQIFVISGIIKNVDSEGLNPLLKIKNLSGGNYYVGMKDGTTGYFISIKVKYSHNEDDVYIYSVVSSDKELKRIKAIATETKLSDMAKGIKSNIILRISSEDYWFVATK